MSNPTPAKFIGTSNPRHLRTISALLTRPRRREDVDSIAGASNGPMLISDIRDLFFPVKDDRDYYIGCDRIRFIDRDGRPCNPGIYSLTPAGKRLIRDWQLRIKKDSEASHE